MKYTKLFIAILAVLAILRIAISSVMPLSSDEAYHWEWSRHIDLGYYDHPPLTAYIIFIFTRVFGDREIGVRFGAIVMMTLASSIMFKLGKDVSGNERVAFWSGILVNIVPMLNVFFVYMSTDPAAILFWALTLWLIWRAIFQENESYWYLLGMAIGGGLLAKFLNVLIIPAIALYILLSGKWRRLLKMKEPYVAVVIAFAVISPFIFWNTKHSWATFGFNLAKRHSPELGLGHFLEYLTGQTLVVSPLLFIGFIFSIFYSWRRWFMDHDERHLFFASTSSAMFGFFFLMSFFGSIGAHWPAAGYLTACVALPYIAVSEKQKLIVQYAKTGIIVALAMLVIAYSLLMAAYFRPASIEAVASKFSKESDEIYEMHGWEALGIEAERRAEENKAIIITPSYAACSMLAFYTPSRMQTHMFGKGAIHGLNYEFWDGDFSQFHGRNAIWLYKEPPKMDDMSMMRLSFESVGEPEKYSVDICRSKARTFYFVRCLNLIRYMVE